MAESGYTRFLVCKYAEHILDPTSDMGDDELWEASSLEVRKFRKSEEYRDKSISEYDALMEYIKRKEKE